MPRHKDNLYKRKDGRWEGRYIKEYLDGKAKYGYVYGHSYREAREKLLVARNTPPPTASTQITIGDLLDLWMEGQRDAVKQSTFATYHHVVYSHIAPMIGSLKPNELHPQMLEALLLEKLKTGRLDGQGGLSGKTVQDITTIIKSVACYSNTRGIALDIGELSLKLKWQKGLVKTLSGVDQSKLLQFVKDDINPKKAGVVLCLYTGLRLGEICALSWKDICLDSETLWVTKTLQRISDVSGLTGRKTMLILDSPKSVSSIREIPIPSFVVQLLQDMKTDGDAYFLSGRREQFVEPRTYENIFKAYIRQSGIRQTNFHTLRHTFATRCIECGMDVKSLSEILGHSDIKITLNTYVHPTMSMKRAGLEKLSTTFV